MTYGRFGEKVSGSVSKYIRVVGSSGCTRQQSLNSVIKFYGVEYDSARRRRRQDNRCGFSTFSQFLGTTTPEGSLCRRTSKEW